MNRTRTVSEALSKLDSAEAALKAAVSRQKARLKQSGTKRGKAAKKASSTHRTKKHCRGSCKH